MGTGFGEFRWMRPVYPDDTLHLDIEVDEVRPSRSKPKQGVAKVRITVASLVYPASVTVASGATVTRRHLEDHA